MEIVFRNTNLQILKTLQHEFRNAVDDTKIERVEDIVIISFSPFDLDSLISRSTFSKRLLFFFYFGIPFLYTTADKSYEISTLR